MSERAELLRDIADAADALTEPYKHTELIPFWDHNRNRKVMKREIRFDSILEQLRAKAVPGQGEQEGHGVHESRPPADLDAVSAYAVIAIGAFRFAWSAKLQTRDATASQIRGLVGAAPSLDSDVQEYLLQQLRGWHHMAAVLTGWRTPPYSPPAPCPHCDARDRIRIRRDTLTGVCIACQAGWTKDTIGVLASHVQRYVDEARAANREARRRAVEERRRLAGDAA